MKFINIELHIFLSSLDGIFVFYGCSYLTFLDTRFKDNFMAM